MIIERPCPLYPAVRPSIQPPMPFPCLFCRLLFSNYGSLTRSLNATARPLGPHVQIARLGVAFILSGDAVRGEEESASSRCDCEEDAIAAAEMRCQCNLGWRRALVMEAAWTYLRKDMLLDE